MIGAFRRSKSSARPRLLDDGHISARVRHWPGRPDIAHLVLVDHTIAPSASSLHEWVDALRSEGYTSIRTGALSGDAAERFEAMNFYEIQELALLRLGASISTRIDSPVPHHEMRPLRTIRSMDIAARIDQEAFDFGWQLDALGIREACRATPTHRIRLALTSTAEPVGYMITGRHGSAGFIQRLAVSPTHAGQGVATSLLQDGLKWLGKAGVSDILVNTHLDNQRALDLYHRLGFATLPETLRVMQWDAPVES